MNHTISSNRIAIAMGEAPTDLPICPSCLIQICDRWEEGREMVRSEIIFNLGVCPLPMSVYRIFISKSLRWLALEKSMLREVVKFFYSWQRAYNYVLNKSRGDSSFIHGKKCSSEVNHVENWHVTRQPRTVSSVLGRQQRAVAIAIHLLRPSSIHAWTYM